MAVETIEAIFRLRRDTAANWASVNPILELAEPGLETDTNKVKYGDGATAWNSLPYSAAAIADILATARTLSATGDVTWSGTFNGSANFSVTATIANGAVTLVKMANMATASLIYRKSAGSGPPEVNSLATLKTDLGLTGTNSGDQTTIVGITGTKAQFNTAVTDGDIVYTDTLDTDTTLAANSDTRLATQKAVKTYVDQSVAGLLDLKGGQNCSANPNYPAASKGDAYYVTAAGKIGGASGKSVDIGDVIIAFADNAGGTEAAVGTNWFVLEHNLLGALLAANNLSDLGNVTTARTNLGLGTLATQNGTFSGTSSGTNTGDQTTVTGNAGTATALQTSRNIDGQAFNGTADITVIAPGTHAATSKATPVDADEIPLVDSAAANVLKKLTWANLKATLKTYFDTIYQPLSTALSTLAGLTATTDNFIISVGSAWASRTPAQARNTLGFGSNAYTTGTSFPGSPTSGDMCYRTDRAIEYYYDGTRWLSTSVYFVPIPNTDFLLPRTTTTLGMCRAANPWAALYDIYVMDAVFHNYLTATSTWTLAIIHNNATVGTTLATRSTASDAANTHLSNRVAVNAVVSSAVDNLQAEATLVSGAASLYCSFGLTYRLVG